MNVLRLTLFALACAGCAGTLDDPSRFSDAAPPPPGQDAAPQETGGDPTDSGDAGNTNDGGCLEVPKTFHDTCALSGCHSAGSRTQGLDLETPGVAARLLGVPAMGGGLLIDPATPNRSVIYTKLTAMPPFGSQMPLGKTAFDDAALACVLAWVSSQSQAADGGSD